MIKSTLARCISQEDREFLYPWDTFLGTILTAHPVAVFLGFSLTSSVLLFLPAWILGIHSIVVDPKAIPGFPCADWTTGTSFFEKTNVGILYKLNWSLAYPLLIPLIFCLAAIACRSARRGFVDLVEDGTVLPDDCSDNKDPQLFLAAIRAKIARWDRTIFYLSLGIAIAATLIAANVFSKTGNLSVYWKVLRSGKLDAWYAPCLWDDMDWMHGWTIPGHQGSGFYMIGNLLFYLFTQLLQGFVVLVASSFVLKFLVLTQSFASVIIEDKSGFHFEPFISDPEKCLGLRPLGRIFSVFLLLSIFFEIFAFGCRLQLILTKQHCSLFGYFHRIWTDIQELGKVHDITAGMQKVLDLQTLAGFHDLNQGLVAMLTLATIPVITIAWLPVFRVRNYVARRRKEKLKEFRAAERDARFTLKYDQAKHLSEDMEKLSKASIWPNGFKIGWGSFFFLFAILFSTFVPPLIVPLVTGGLGLKIFKKITAA